MEYQPVPIEEVIKNFYDCGFPDLGSAIPYMKRLFKDHIPDQDTPTDEIKQIVISELKALQKAIPIHFEGEFMVLPGQDGTDNKMGHWYTLHWIFARWMHNSDPANKGSDVPAWYLACVHVIPSDSNRGGKMCQNVIKKLLTGLENN